MRDGFYTMKYKSPYDQAGGVCFVKDGRFTGGDTLVWWTGPIRETNGTVEIDLDVRRHGEHGVSIFGDHDRFRVRLKGRAEAGRVALSGHAEVGSPVAVEVTMIRIDV